MITFSSHAARALADERVRELIRNGGGRRPRRAARRRRAPVETAGHTSSRPIGPPPAARPASLLALPRFLRREPAPPTAGAEAPSGPSTLPL